VRWNREHFGENIGNQLGTWREHSANTLGSPEKWKKNPPPPTQKEKKQGLECMLGPSHWLHEISLPKRLGHHFWPGLTPLAKNTLPIQCWGAFDLKNNNCPFFQTFGIPENCFVSVSEFRHSRWQSWDGSVGDRVESTWLNSSANGIPLFHWPCLPRSGYCV
jgi:hypothetical protein